jgi:Na+/melibiose symporter-like transporter
VRDVLRNRDFRYLLAGQALSRFGDWFMLLAVPYFVLRLTGSTLASGLSLATETVPALLLSPVAGVFVDRWDRRRTMIVTNVARAGVVFPMVLVHHRNQVPLIYAALFAEASLSQLFNPAWQAVIPAIVGRGPELRSANSLDGLVSGIVRLLGAPAGGALYAFLGFGPIVWADTGSYCVAAVFVGLVGYRAPREDHAEPHASGSAWPVFLRQAREGWTYVRKTPGFTALFV